MKLELDLHNLEEERRLCYFSAIKLQLSELIAKRWSHEVLLLSQVSAGYVLHYDSKAAVLRHR